MTTKKSQTEELAEQKAILDGISEVIYVSDPDTYELLYMNEAALNIWGQKVGEKCYEVLQNLDSPCPFCTNHIIFSKDTDTHIWEFQNQVSKVWFRCIDKAIDWPDGRRVRYEMAVDITRQKEMEQALIAQSQEILDLSTPVIKIWEGVVIAPLIGTLDSQRTQHFMERFLNTIVDTKSAVALIDITGVPTIDTQTAQHILETISASRLIGTRVILTGVSPAIAQTIVHLGIDLTTIDTHTSLHHGLKIAFNILGLEISQTMADNAEQ